MEELLEQFDAEKRNEPYPSNKAYLVDLFVLTRLRLENLLQEEADEDFPLLVRHLEEHIESRLKAGAGQIFIPLLYLRSVFLLEPFEENCLILSLMNHASKDCESLFAQLQGDPQLIQPTFDLCLHLFAEEALDAQSSTLDLYFMLKRKLFKYFFINTQRILNAPLVLTERAAQFILCAAETEYDEHYFSVWHPGEETLSVESPDETPADTAQQNDEAAGADTMPDAVQADITESILQLLMDGADERCKMVCLVGDEGAGRKFHVKRTAARIGRGVIFADLDMVYTEEENILKERLYLLIRETFFQNALLCLHNLDRLAARLEESQLITMINLLILVVSKDLPLVFLGMTAETLAKTRIQYGLPLLPAELYVLDIPGLTRTERETVWRMYGGDLLPDTVNCRELADKFKLTPGKIVRAMGEAAQSARLRQESVDMKRLIQCCYKQTAVNLKDKATLARPTQVLSDLILPPEQLAQIAFVIDKVRLRAKVYEEWGFDEKLTYGKGLTVLFEGPPGTGKTMAAHVIANSLQLDMYKVDLARVVSKYIGETEQNLNIVFNEAKKSNVVLFFDETDALFGKRTEVKESKDRYANIETSFLLQKVEEYDGVVIMATNYLQNIDDAFMRRINTIVHFPFPAKPDRIRIWKSMFPPALPVGNLDYDYLGGRFELAGGDIKNIALDAAFLAARQDSEVQMIHVIKALKAQLSKQGKAVLKEDFGQYQYLLLM